MVTGDVPGTILYPCWEDDGSLKEKRNPADDADSGSMGMGI